MSGRIRRLRRERSWDTYKLCREVSRRAYSDITPLGPTRRAFLIAVERSKGGGAGPFAQGNEASELLSLGLIEPHKNIYGYYIATPKGVAECKKLYDALSAAGA